MSTTETRVPVTILTGFLGAGKTTLLNRILTEDHGLRIAVIENEFGEIGIDHDLVINAEEELFEMNNGCICCTVRGDLIRILGNLMKRRDKFDHILIETTGLANPGPVVQTFFADEEMESKLSVNAVVTLVDAKHILLHIDDESGEAKEQIAFADVILLNKCDLVSPEELDRLEKRIKSINALAKIHRTTNAQIEIEKVLDVGGFNLEHAVEIDPHFLEREAAHEHGHHDHDHDCDEHCDHEKHDHVCDEHCDHDHEEGHHHHHHHDETVTSIGLVHEGFCDGKRLNEWLSELLRTKGQDIYRTKGVFAIKGNPDRVVFQGVHMIMTAASGGPWNKREQKCTLVFIGKNLDRAELTKAFKSCCLN